MHVCGFVVSPDFVFRSSKMGARGPTSKWGIISPGGVLPLALCGSAQEGKVSTRDLWTVSVVLSGSRNLTVSYFTFVWAKRPAKERPVGF